MLDPFSLPFFQPEASGSRRRPAVAATGALVAGGVGLLARRQNQNHDAVTALVLVGALGIGFVLASDVFMASGNVEGLLL